MLASLYLANNSVSKFKLINYKDKGRRILSALCLYRVILVVKIILWWRRILLLFYHDREVEILYYKAHAELETAEEIIFFFQRVAFAVQVDKFVEKFELFARKLRA